MKGFVIKFSEKAGVFNLFLTSILASTVSLITPYSAFIQFISSAMFVALLIASFNALSNRDEEDKFKILQLLLIAALSISIIEVIPVFAILVTIYIVYSTFLSGRSYLMAFFSHILDFLTTRLALPEFEESNLFMSVLMSLVGVDFALVIMKVFLIAVLLLYSSKKLEGKEESLFVNGVTVIGLSMAARNAILLFSSV
jgi:uncharacterized membrane protein